ncbi:tRNA (guanosine(37)-N1)-methyltransferase TrmD [bacterium]|nr:tRNA (guanosine(37)-N1)-methyltransferase TrmD [bacterium]
MRFDILTIFPEMFAPFLCYGMIKRARDKGLLTVYVHDLRVFTTDSHRSVDDVPYGGGPGMVMKIEPIHRAVTAICPEGRNKKRILLSPDGRKLNTELARCLASDDSLLLICGRYEGVDERVSLHLVDDEISIGDYILSGGEVPAMVLMEAIVRFIPGALGNRESLAEESFTGKWLEYPQYTRPAEFEGKKVPEVLLSGNHQEIKEWRHRQSLIRTAKRRPDLIDWALLTAKEIGWLAESGVTPHLKPSGKSI